MPLPFVMCWHRDQCTRYIQTIMLMQREIRVTQNSIGLCQPKHINLTLKSNCKLLLLLLSLCQI